MFNRDHHDTEIARKLGSDGMVAVFVAGLVALLSFMVMATYLDSYLSFQMMAAVSIILAAFVGIWLLVRNNKKRTSGEENARKTRAENIESETKKQIDAMQRKASNIPKAKRS
jgi:ABC-type nickel/cobalt efflux system permease component RcnA